MIMIGRASFIGLKLRHWMTIAAIQWQFLATGGGGARDQCGIPACAEEMVGNRFG